MYGRVQAAASLRRRNPYGGTLVQIAALHARFVIPLPRMVSTILAMQARQALASSSVAAAAGSMIWLSFAVSPPITLVPERPAPVDASGNVSSLRKQTIETVSAAVADTFEHRWHDILQFDHSIFANAAEVLAHRLTSEKMLSSPIMQPTR